MLKQGKTTYVQKLYKAPEFKMFKGGRGEAEETGAAYYFKPFLLVSYQKT